MKVCLLIGGIINIILSIMYYIISILFGGFTSIIFLLVLISGILFINFYYNIYNKKNIILILSILLIPFSPISAILGLITATNLKNNNKRAPNIDPELKKIDILIKIGVSLIILSSILFIYSYSNTYSKYIVVSLLCIFLLIFYGLYKLFSIKFVLPQSKNLYYILYNSFIPIIFFTINHYNYFNLINININLFYTILFILIAYTLKNIKKLINNNILEYLIMLVLNISLYNLLIYLKFNSIQTILIIYIITLFIKHIAKNKYLLKYSTIIMNLIIYSSIFYIFKGYSISLIMIYILNILVVTYLGIKKKKEYYEIISPIIFYTYLSSIISLLINYMELSYNLSIIIFITIITLLHLTVLFEQKFKNIITKNIFIILYNLTLLLSTIISLFINGNLLLFIILIRLFSILTYIYFRNKYKVKDIEYYLIPINIVMLYISSIIYLKNYISINLNIILLTLIILISILYSLNKNKVLDIIYNILLIIMIYINILTFNKDIMFILISLFTTIIPTVISYIKKDNIFNINIFITLLGSFIILFNNVFDIYTNFMLNLFIFIIIYLLDKDKLKYLLLLISIPIINLLLKTNLTNILKNLLINITLFYSLLILIFKLIKDNNLRKILFIILSSLILLLVIFRTNNIYGIYVGIISILLILISTIYNNMKNITIFGIVLLIINILYRMIDILSSLPFWLYLLLSGLFIIIFATIKEIRRKK